MPKVTVKITNFSGGMSKDRRSGWVGSMGGGFATNRFSLTKHFDVFTYPKKLVPYHKTEADETKANDMVKFLFAPATSLGVGEERLWAFGVDGGGSNRGTMYYHADPVTDLGWTSTSGRGTTRNEDVFFYYKDFIYFWSDGNKLIAYNTTNAGISDFQTISYTNLAQPVHHPADDVAYFFHDNKISSLDDTSWSLAALTLPAQFKIVAAAPYGNYLAIACVTLQVLDIRSVVFLWDRDSSLATLTERIDFGEGEIKHLANLNNKLIAIMSFYGDDLTSLDRGSILIKQASRNFAVTLNEILLDAQVATADFLEPTRFISGNKIYFPTKATLNGDPRQGIWVVDEFGRTTLDFIEEDIAANEGYEGIFKTGNMWWIAHSNDGSVNRTDNNKVYSTTLASVYETLIFTAGDSSITKKLIGAEVMFEKLPTAGQVVLKYRIDGATSWTTIFTHTTDNSISHEAINDSSGANLKEYKEVEFQINSTGGAVITGLRFVSDITNKGRLF